MSTYEDAIAALKDAQEKGIVLGLANLGLGAVERMDVDVLLSKYPDTFNLYLLALDELAHGNKDKMAYYEIAGIHGLPNRPWNNIKDGNHGGYCPHGTIYFPTWHRAYLLMIEQSIYYTMHLIAERFTTDKERWVNAVKKFRLPFWDYFRPRGAQASFPGVQDEKIGRTTVDWEFSVPKVFTEQYILVQRPGEEKSRLLENPLNTYGFQIKDETMKQGWNEHDADMRKDAKDPDLVWLASRAQTVRYPPQSRAGNGIVMALNQTIQMFRAPNIELLMNMMTQRKYDTYYNFACTHRKRGDPIANGSLEGLHNQYHGLIGGNGGHMSEVPTAAFDPIFWLHHANIDRYFAIWQATHEGWITDVESEKHLELKEQFPFVTVKDVGERKPFWNSQFLKNIEDLGYTYGDVAGSGGAILDNLARNYKWSLPEELRGGIPDEPPANMLPINVMKTQFFDWAHWGPEDEKQKKHGIAHFHHQAGPEDNALFADDDTQEVSVQEPEKLERPPRNDAFDLSDEELLADKPEGTRLIRQWYIDSKVLRNARDTAFSIYYFLGDFKDEPESYHRQPTLIGFNHIFVNSKNVCKNCADQAAQQELAYNTCPITSKLLTFVQNGAMPLKGLHPEQVLAFLKTNLKWRVLGGHMTPLADETVELKVSISSTISFLPPNETIPTWDSATNFPEVTGVGEDLN